MIRNTQEAISSLLIESMVGTKKEQPLYLGAYSGRLTTLVVQDASAQSTCVYVCDAVNKKSKQGVECSTFEILGIF